MVREREIMLSSRFELFVSHIIVCYLTHSKSEPVCLATQNLSVSQLTLPAEASAAKASPSEPVAVTSVILVGLSIAAAVKRGACVCIMGYSVRAQENQR